MDWFNSNYILLFPIQFSKQNQFIFLTTFVKLTECNVYLDLK